MLRSHIGTAATNQMNVNVATRPGQGRPIRLGAAALKSQAVDRRLVFLVPEWRLQVIVSEAWQPP